MFFPTVQPHFVGAYLLEVFEPESCGCAQIEDLSKQILNLIKFLIFHLDFEELLYCKGVVILISKIVEW